MKKTRFSSAILILLLLTLAGTQTIFAASKLEGTVVAAVSTLGAEQWLGSRIESSNSGLTLPMYDYLVFRGQTSSELTPGLATKWEMSKDALTWGFDLRRGVQWHNGWGEFTAEDVKFTFEIAAAEDSRNGFKVYLNKNIKKIEIVNPYRIVFHMASPSPDFIYMLSDLSPFFPMHCKKHIQTVGIEEAGRKPIGTGPFKFVEHRVGDFIKYEAIENHWRKTPYIKYAIIKKVPEETTRVAMLKAGSLDIAPISYKNLKEVEAAGIPVKSLKMGALMAVNLSGQYLASDRTYDPAVPWALPDKKKAVMVRKALSLAINKQEILDYVLQGRGSLEGAGTAPFWPDHPGYDPQWKVDPYDPKEAKRLLAEAGYPDPSKISVTMDTMEVSIRPYNALVSEAVAMFWSRLGIKVKMQKTDWVTLLKKTQAREFAGVAWAFTHTWKDEPYQLLALTGYSDGIYAFFGSYPELDAYITAAKNELDYKRRSKIQHEMGQWMYDNRVTIGICYTDLLFATSKRLSWPTKIPAGMTLGQYHNWEYMKIE